MSRGNDTGHFDASFILFPVTTVKYVHIIHKLGPPINFKLNLRFALQTALINKLYQDSLTRGLDQLNCILLEFAALIKN